VRGGAIILPNMPAAKPRVLLVDDEPSIVMVMGKRLEVEGYDVLIARDGQEALDKVTTQHPDLIVLDLMLPKLNGYEVCSRLKQDERSRHIPIVIFSGKGQADDVERGSECGADAYVMKGNDHTVLIQKVKALLQKR